MLCVMLEHIITVLWCNGRVVAIVFKNKVKSFLSHKANRAALISVSLALSQTAAYAARPWIWG